MDMKSLGKWAWLIALVVWALVEALKGLGIDLGLPTIVVDLVAALAFIGGLFYFADMKDKTGFFITAAALSWFAHDAGHLFIDQLGGVVAGFLTGAGYAAGAAAAGVLVMVVYNWIMDAMK